ncbi:MAG: phosphatase PAP2 family protein [Polaromonas sp.]|uniref:phosphatase PAP2 family protein n=1 Tax=Polaromonas sp. TaxID=1869339 RepID=UPI00273396C2|nr:phosphatase PAP2 family protein [Polaromonas sp.]MDP2817816.1 phosphatase PAP2 family protein [Polaromonas sp.]
MAPDSPAVTAVVQALGAHALLAFGVTLLLVLAGVAVLWHLAQRYGLRRKESRWPPLAYLAAYLALGFGIIAGAAALFAEIAEMLGDGRQLGRLDLLFSDTLAGNSPKNVLRVFTTITHLGDPLTLTVLCVLVALLLLYQRQRWLAAGWVLAIAGNALLNPALKAIFARTRPVHDQALVFADGWSFPSGHASSSVVAYGMLAYLLVRLLPAHWPASLRMAAVLLATVLAFTIGSSRVFLQVHFASDVLAGFASGTAWLAVCIGALELIRYRQAFNRPD